MFETSSLLRHFPFAGIQSSLRPSVEGFRTLGRSYATALSGALNMFIVLPFIANNPLFLPYYVRNQNQTAPNI